MPHNVISFRYFKPMSHGFNKKIPIQVPHPPFPRNSFPVPFTRFSPGLFAVSQEMLYQPFFCSNQIIAKNNAFSKKNKFFLSTLCCVVLILLFCFYVLHTVFFHHSAIKKLRSKISCFHGILFGLSSSHMTKQKNSCFESYKLLLFLRFLRKLSSRLILPP